MCKIGERTVVYIGRTVKRQPCSACFMIGWEVRAGGGEGYIGNFWVQSFVTGWLAQKSPRALHAILQHVVDPGTECELHIRCSNIGHFWPPPPPEKCTRSSVKLAIFRGVEARPIHAGKITFPDQNQPKHPISSLDSIELDHPH